MLVAHDPQWHTMFESERTLLETTLEEWLVAGIEHVGSTAVGGLAAKPIIDIMAPVRSLQASTGAIEPLRELGYLYFPYKSESMHWFCKPSPDLRTHHLHLVPFQSRLWFDRLEFRNALRCNKALASDYAALKYRLAATFAADREAYTAGKSDFVRRALERERRAKG